MALELLSFRPMPRRRWFPAVVRRLIRQTHGQDLIEYGVLVAMVAAGVILAASQIAVKVPGYYTNVAEALPGGSPSGPGRGGNPGIGNPNPGNPGNGNPGNGNPVGNPGSGNPGNGNPGGGRGN